MLFMPRLMRRPEFRMDSAEHRNRRSHDHHRHSGVIGAQPTTGVRDLVCGMTVDPLTSKHRAENQGDTFHFCSAGCRAKFLGDPRRYTRPANEPPAERKAGVVYTCPMHPQIRQDRPGNCPICGMALEPIGAGEGPNPELIDMTRRFWIGTGLSVPVLVLEM